MHYCETALSMMMQMTLINMMKINKTEGMKTMMGMKMSKTAEMMRKTMNIHVIQTMAMPMIQMMTMMQNDAPEQK